jgi:hypothetical protein
MAKKVKIETKKFVPLEKMSKKAKKKHFTESRNDWNGVNPTTKVVKSKKIYDRNKFKNEDLSE